MYIGRPKKDITKPRQVTPDDRKRRSRNTEGFIERPKKTERTIGNQTRELIRKSGIMEK